MFETSQLLKMEQAIHSWISQLREGFKNNLSVERDIEYVIV